MQRVDCSSSSSWRHESVSAALTSAAAARSGAWRRMESPCTDSARASSAWQNSKLRAARTCDATMAVLSCLVCRAHQAKRPAHTCMPD